MTRSKKPRPRMGRPPKGAELHAVAWLAKVRVSEEERATVARLAAKHGLSVSEWVRRRATSEHAATS